MAKKTKPAKTPRIRVYRLAEELGVAGKELLPFLQELGYPFKSVQNALDPEDVEQITKAWKKAAKGAKSSGKSGKAATKSPKKVKASKTTPSKAASKKNTKAAEEADAEEAPPKRRPKKKVRRKPQEEDSSATVEAAKEKSTEKGATRKKTEEPPIPEVLPPASESELPNDTYLRGLTQHLLRTALVPDARVEEGNSSSATKQFRVHSDEKIEIPNQREVLHSITYLLNKTDTYHFGGGRRFVLQLEGSHDAKGGSLDEDGDNPLATMAGELAELVQRLGKSLVIDQLSSQERRGIHTALADQGSSEVSTFSDGEGIFRRLNHQSPRQVPLSLLPTLFPRSLKRSAKTRIRGADTSVCPNERPPNERLLQRRSAPTLFTERSKQVRRFSETSSEKADPSQSEGTRANPCDGRDHSVGLGALGGFESGICVGFADCLVGCALAKSSEDSASGGTCDRNAEQRDGDSVSLKEAFGRFLGSGGRGTTQRHFVCQGEGGAQQQRSFEGRFVFRRA